MKKLLVTSLLGYALATTQASRNIPWSGGYMDAAALLQNLVRVFHMDQNRLQNYYAKNPGGKCFHMTAQNQGFLGVQNFQNGQKGSLGPNTDMWKWLLDECLLSPQIFSDAYLDELAAELAQDHGLNQNLPAGRPKAMVELLRKGKELRWAQLPRDYQLQVALTVVNKVVHLPLLREMRPKSDPFNAHDPEGLMASADALAKAMPGTTTKEMIRLFFAKMLTSEWFLKD